MTEIPWNTIVPTVGGLLTVAGTVYGINLSHKVKQTELRQEEQKQEFTRERERHNAIVSDVTRCESRIDELQGLVKKWMSDYDDLHSKHLAECQAHNTTQLALAETKRDLETARRQLKATMEECEKFKAQVETLEKMLTRTMTAKETTTQSP